MPKVIDHQQYRAQLALQAAEVFLKHGYRQLGMRQLAHELGVSKSKLYHYFASKEALFSAATEAIIAADSQAFAPPQVSQDSEQQVEQLIGLINAWLPRFSAELRLTMDYIEIIGQERVGDDSVMQLSQQKYRDLFAAIVGHQRPDAAYGAALGILCNRLLSGQHQCGVSDRQLLTALLAAGCHYRGNNVFRYSSVNFRYQPRF